MAASGYFARPCRTPTGPHEPVRPYGRGPVLAGGKSRSAAADRAAAAGDLAAWRASRSGLDAALLNPVTGLPEQARIVVNMLLHHCRDALADAGEADTVAELPLGYPGAMSTKRL